MDALAHILARVEEKKHNYARYDFSRRQDDALKAFFDLAQEFDRLEDLYCICVAVPKAYFGLEANLYVLDHAREALVLVCTSNGGYLGDPENLPSAEIPRGDEAHVVDESFFAPIRGKMTSLEGAADLRKTAILGVLEIHPGNHLTDSDQLYFEKFANRVGYALYNKVLSETHKERLKFINSLVADIEHNVIVPNMVYRLFLRRLQAKIRKNQEIESVLGQLSAELAAEGVSGDNRLGRLLGDLQEVNQVLTDEFSNIDKHHRNFSLFLESLFRRSHFQQGRFIPQTRRCNFKKEVIDPQLDRFIERFRLKGIEIDSRLGGVPDETMEVVVDVGLISQVYSNLFSNALKYSSTVYDESGTPRKFIAFGRQVLKNFFGPGKDGFKFNVFSTGPHLPVEEREVIFDEGHRGIHARGEPGSGHGLSFVKSVVRIHGGVVGYEPTHLGNNFYFILPQ
ncbi:MAG TPA: ATP-binding protein [Syntrophobacteria bacterium]|nr:ATP-binding protein [Syntrophobacteria bacterium]